MEKKSGNGALWILADLACHFPVFVRRQCATRENVVIYGFPILVPGALRGFEVDGMRGAHLGVVLSTTLCFAYTEERLWRKREVMIRLHKLQSDRLVDVMI